MKVKIDTQLNGADGTPLNFPKTQTAGDFINSLPEDLQARVMEFYNKDTKGTPRLLKNVCLDTILMPSEADDEKAKLMKYDIYKKLFAAKEEVELTAEEISMVKKCIGKFQPQLIMGQCFELIEKPKTDNKKGSAAK
jgi:hypothetical protein